jgi:multisubunit Na+/H+ antiporter MnhF subunit
MARLTDRPPVPPPGSPLLPPAPRPQLPPADPALAQRATAALLLALLSLIAMMLIGNLQRARYVLEVACVVALVGFVLAVSAMRSAKRSGTRRPRASLAAAVLSGLCTVFAGLAAIGFLIFGAQFTQYSNCLNAAGSSTAAQNACQTTFNNAITARMNHLAGH